VSERIDLDPALEDYAVSSDLMHEICRHALDVKPEECCGFVLGDTEERFRRVIRVSNIMTKMHLMDPVAFPRDARHAYYMSEVEYQRALDEAVSHEETVTAVYHSHVDQGCYLSEDDLSFADHPLFPFPEASQIVVSVLADRVAEVGIFDRAPGLDGRFQGRRLEVGA